MQSVCPLKFQEKTEKVKSVQVNCQNKVKKTRNKRLPKKQQQVQIKDDIGSIEIIQISSLDKTRDNSLAKSASLSITNNNNGNISGCSKQQQYNSEHRDEFEERRKRRGNDANVNNKKTNSQPVMIDLPNHCELNSYKLTQEQGQQTTRAFKFSSTNVHCDTNSDNKMDRSSSINHHYRPVANYNTNNNNGFDRQNQVSNFFGEAKI